MKMSILMPVYNGSAVLADTLRNVLGQSFGDYELIVNDDCSTDDTPDIVRSFGDTRIKFARNEVNLGYPGNLEACRRRGGGEILFLMGQDDLLAKDAILQTSNAFELAEDIGAVTRPFFWFDTDVSRPVRAVRQLDPNRDEVVRIADPYERIAAVFHTVGQLSGLALRAEYVDRPFHADVFPCHIYPFASIMKRHPIAFLKDYTVAVRIETSQCRSVSRIYEKSPVQSWIDMYSGVFEEPEFSALRSRLIRDHAATNYLGLVQIKNYGRYRWLLREISVLLRHRKANIWSPAFWFFSLGSILMPRFLLIPLVDWYKKHVHARLLRDINFEIGDPADTARS